MIVCQLFGLRKGVEDGLEKPGVLLDQIVSHGHRVHDRENTGLGEVRSLRPSAAVLMKSRREVPIFIDPMIVSFRHAMPHQRMCRRTGFVIDLAPEEKQGPADGGPFGGVQIVALVTATCAPVFHAGIIREFIFKEFHWVEW